MSIYEGLNDKQREAVLCTEGPLLILAGAGSGKTRVLTHRIAYLIEEKGVNPWNILAITFTNKAAGEMRERVDKIVGFGAESVWVSTFHSTCVRILRRYIDRLGFDTNFTIYDTDDQKTLMKGLCRQFQIDTKYLPERSIMTKISHAKEKGINPDEYEKRIAAGDFTMKKVAMVYRAYQEQLKKSNALDFDDLLVKTVELFQAEPEVLESYQNRFRYIMIDEYQDTNYIQFKLVSLLAAKYQNLCVVGDDDQSIYKFRGADIENILGFEKTFPAAQVIRLEQNYRSTKRILEAANCVISNNEERKKKTLWTENEDGEFIHFHKFDNGFGEASFIAEDIQKKHEKGLCSYKDCAILYRTNAQSRLLEEKLLLEGIPYKLVGGINFYARKEIKDLICYLKTVDNARDDLAVKRILNVPKRGIGLTTQGRIQDYADEMEMSFYDALCEAETIPGMGRSAGKIKGFVSLIQALRSKAEEYTVRELLEDIITDTEYVDQLRAEGTEEAEARIENIDELISKAQSYEDACKASGQEGSLGNFLEEIALIADIDSVDPEQDYVLLMTFHTAKGLEFPRVYMAGMEDGLFPSYMALSSDDMSDLEEERRLCYVGITRAMKDLTMTYSHMRMVRGETRINRISRFVQEIPRELVDLGNASQEKRAASASESSAGSHRPISAYEQMRQAFHANVFQPKTYAVTKSASLEYQEGDRVRHMKFGLGVVRSIVDGGKDYEVTVDFDKVGVKKMFAGFAKLKKIQE
ncbi:MAG: DNA helicase PcrA [Eubacteriales bacterium]|nr:DNA helicase PcrA [Eubacteriales bacterium]